jgi:hypothetical protein
MQFTIEKLDHVGDVAFQGHWSVCFWMDGCMISRRPATREEVILWELCGEDMVEVTDIDGLYRY